MALTFRYRFVDFGTVFAGEEGIRGETQGSERPSTLFSNELVTDVGGLCLNGDERLAVIDHHFTRDAQFPAASAAVLHKAELIRSRFSGQRDGVFWLVTHKQPDFDAFCSMYLARWILEDEAAVVDWHDCGLHPDGWLDFAERRKIHWFAPDLQSVAAERRWPLLMASYASIVDNGQHFPCPRNRALHSVLYAALKRGRDYLAETSGATELFDEIKIAIRDGKKNPIFDSVLEESREFAPELAMLDREVEAYHRDVRRARKSIVYLQRSGAPFSAFFDKLKQRPLLAERDGTLCINPEHLLSGQPRVATDGIYLRDPECLLFKEWARLDLENSSLGKGFEFTAVAYSNGRPEGDPNPTDYFFAIDPERANGRHLYAVWARLQGKEVEALRARAKDRPKAADRPARRGFEGRAGTLGGFFADPWFDGQNYFCTIVATPNHGTLIGSAGIEAGLRDDSIVEAVRNEVEYSIYQGEPPGETVCVAVFDLSATKSQHDSEPRKYDIAALKQIQAPTQRRFRFARIALRQDVPIALAGGTGLSLQIGETLWRVLYPDLPAAPPDFAQRHLAVGPRCVGVWGNRGIAIAYKPSLHQRTEPHEHRSEDDAGIRQDFVSIVALARDIDQLIADGEALTQVHSSASALHSQLLPEGSPNLAEEIAARGEVLARKAAQIKHNLTLPDSDLLRRFYDATGIDELLTTLRDLNQTAAEHLRREKMEDQARRLGESTETVAEVQSKLEWLEVFIVGVYAIEMIEAFTKRLDLRESWINLSIVIGVPVFLVLTVFILQPWSKKASEQRGGIPRPAWILIIVLAGCLFGIARLLWLLVRN